ncbi:hypothetical protein T484DRAFT_1946218 [Baffinella frigidus]|nr:hypothetical protein T484DRAFT_1946218 [Cryptophyta sp. CCMP2293]|mmetsp:Transcript_60661/g.144264  ORF Transcript_60661/g.144264 Transcript_60661/m.144264 type:complete len:210 (+) Transcript_60661:85-714(+)
MVPEGGWLPWDWDERAMVCCLAALARATSSSSSRAYLNHMARTHSASMNSKSVSCFIRRICTILSNLSSFGSSKSWSTMSRSNAETTFFARFGFAFCSCPPGPPSAASSSANSPPPWPCCPCCCSSCSSSSSDWLTFSTEEVAWAAGSCWAGGCCTGGCWAPEKPLPLGIAAPAFCKPAPFCSCERAAFCIAPNGSALPTGTLLNDDIP